MAPGIEEEHVETLSMNGNKCKSRISYDLRKNSLHLSMMILEMKFKTFQ